MTGVVVSPKLRRNCQAKQSALSSNGVAASRAVHFILLPVGFGLLFVPGAVQRSVGQSRQHVAC